MSKYKLLEQAQINIDRIINVISKFEGVNFTIPQTRRIINKQRDEDKFRTNYDYRVIWTLKQAFIDIRDQIMFRNGDIFNHEYALRINYILTEFDVLKPGEFNTFHAPVNIGEKEHYEPNFLSIKQSMDLLDRVALSNYSVNDIVNLFGKIITHQVFNDGNKRTALLFCNSLLLKKNMAFIDITNMELFNKILNDLYWSLKRKRNNGYEIFNRNVIKYFIVYEISKQKIGYDGFKTVSCVLDNRTYEKLMLVCLNEQRSKGFVLRNLIMHYVFGKKIMNFKRQSSKNNKTIDTYKKNYHVSCRLKYSEHEKLIEFAKNNKKSIYLLLKSWLINLIKNT